MLCAVTPTEPSHKDPAVPTEAEITEALRPVEDPELHRSIVDLGMVKEIAQAADLPAPYLAKIIQTLARKGIVVTQRGIGGGVTLARPANEISLFDLGISLDDPAVQAQCMLGTAQCSDERCCPAHKYWSAERAKIHEQLKTMTIADIAAFETRRRWKANAKQAD